MASPLPTKLDWPSAVGNFILNYGVLDWHALVFLESRMPPDEFTKIKGKPFHDRITRVKGIAASENYSNARKLAFAEFFTRLDPVRELRNRIAHGHLLVRMARDGESPVMTLSLPKDLDVNDAAETRHLEFKELTSALNALTALIEEFENLSGDWRSET